MTASSLHKAAHILGNGDGDYDPLLDMVGDASFVLLGEGSHGTHEFYRQRAEITKRLIAEKGFSAVAVEADWPDAYRVNRYVRGEGADPSANAALSGFKRFPTWMWRNTDVLDFVEWLKRNNDGRPEDVKAGFFGLDLYSLFNSMQAVVEYLERVDPEAAKRARYRYGCFEHFSENTQAYGYVASFDVARSCEDDAVNQLVDMQRRGLEYLNKGGADDYFAAEQNARLVMNAEHYYRAMFRGARSSWNLRDTHMADTVHELVGYLKRQGRKPKIVIWAHNSHLGDARATEMGQRGEHNLGQLLREKYGPEAVLVGFTTYTGTVTAASEWDDPGEQKRVRPALVESYECEFHELGLPAFFLNLRKRADSEVFSRPRLERAIGVIYRPETERLSHYFQADMPAQFDGVIHTDVTTAVHPLEKPLRWDSAEPPETYPTGM